MIVEIPIPDDKVAAFTVGFLEMCPIPQILDPEWEEGVDPDPQPMVDEYTKLEWLIKKTQKEWFRWYEIGIIQKAGREAIIDKNII